MNAPAHPQVQRSLAAIVITDAVGFSKWMSQDEDSALAIINQDLQVIKDLCNTYEGKILKTTGDGVLMYFISGVQAVSCAIEIQKKFARLAKNDRAKNKHFTHRIGVHLGDIFFNQEDMMGTGVNIAARLESEAKPGAICMSQVVYEVVKYRLTLDAVYAGELSLKNIEQSVSAYHVWPPEIRPNKSPEQFSEAIFSLVTPLNTALKVFSSHPQSHRIKKLLYATHKGVWENNLEMLKGVSLKLLVESLTNRNLNLNECQESLNIIIRTLNRPDCYRQVADIILENIQDFYTENNDGSQVGLERPSLITNDFQSLRLNPLPPSPIEMQNNLNSILINLNSSSGHISVIQHISETLREFYAERGDGSRISIGDPSQLEQLLNKQQGNKTRQYREVANRLDTSKDSVLIKQLLYCVCCNQWETHLDRIQAVPMLSLVQGLDQQVDSLESLRSRLHTILSRLDCRKVYTPVAGEVFRASQPLYFYRSNPNADIIHLRREKLSI